MKLDPFQCLVMRALSTIIHLLLLDRKSASGHDVQMECQNAWVSRTIPGTANARPTEAGNARRRPK
jgi:hypothetical protein